MSDVTVAPQAAPPPPASNEVAINPNPVSAPSPIGSQAPDKPVGDIEGGKGRPESRREAIQRAFDKANKDKPKATEAKAKIGHNQPPEETEKLDLKQPPKREVYREGGKFARPPEQPQGAAPAAQHAAPDPRQQRPAQALPETAAFREPPPRFSERGRSEWATAPESVRGDVHRMAHEFEGAYRKYRADHETMNSIRHFHEMAQQHGTTLDRALHNYTSMENKLRNDVVGGLDVIVNNLNLRTADGQKLGLRDVAYHILNQSPEQHRIVQTNNVAQAAQHQIGALHQEVTGLKNALHQMHTAQQFTQTRSAVDQFADQHPRFDELGDLIEQELQFGFDLHTAYQRAERLRPSSPHAAQTRAPSAPAQTRPSKSISGAPDSSGPSDGQRKSGKQVGRREAIQNAIRRVNGGV